MAKSLLPIILLATTAFAANPAGSDSPPRVSISVAKPHANDARSIGRLKNGDVRIENHELSQIAMALWPTEIWVDAADVATLPPGNFDVEISGKEESSRHYFDAFVAHIRTQFAVEIYVDTAEWDGYELRLPPEAAAKLTRAKEGENRAIFTGGRGWVLRAVTLTDVQAWLSKELNEPVLAVKPADEKFTLEVENSVFEPQRLPEALKKHGFEVKKAKIQVNVLKSKKVTQK